MKLTKETCISKVERVLRDIGGELTAAEVAILLLEEPRTRVSTALLGLLKYKGAATRDITYRGINIPVWWLTPETDTRAQRWGSITEAKIHRASKLKRKHTAPTRTPNRF